MITYIYLPFISEGLLVSFPNKSLLVSTSTASDTSLSGLTDCAFMTAPDRELPPVDTIMKPMMSYLKTGQYNLYTFLCGEVYDIINSFKLL